MLRQLCKVMARVLALPVIVACASTGSVEVTVVDASTESPIQGRTVSVSGASSTQVTDAAGQTLFADVPTGLQTVGLIGGCPASRHVSVVDGATVQIRYWDCADVVEAPGAPDESVVAMVDAHSDDGSGTTTCVPDSLRSGVGAVNLNMNAIPFGPCHGAVALFSKNHMLAYSNDASSIPWTNATGDVHRVALSRPLRVPITFMLSGIEPAKISAVTAWVQDIQLAFASRMLRDSFTGLELWGDETGGPVSVLVATAAQATVIGRGCRATNAVKADASIYSQGRLNVYVVPSVNPSGTAVAAGWSCFADLAPDIIYLNASGALPATLIHEIGHALGLQRPQWGHTANLNGFYDRSSVTPLNLMHGRQEIEANYFSISQATRMTLSFDSWLNQPSATDGSSLRQRQAPAGTIPLSFTCPCLPDDSPPDCPVLEKDIPRSDGVKRTGMTNNFACGATVAAPDTISCMMPTPVTVEFTPSGADGIDSWVSLDPSRVAAGKSPDSDRVGILTGLANGPASVRVYVDGSSSTFTVMVTGCT